MALAVASSSSVHPLRHAVFLSFRGADTRYQFVSHLYHALQEKGMPTFIDSENFERGQQISGILNEIESSNVSIIIFSKNYAESPWCLDELVKIIECRKAQGQEVIPIFYHVDPSDVESQKGTYGKAFAKHAEDFKADMTRVRSWKTALTEAANLSGFVLANNRPEAAIIREIVEVISRKLRHLYKKDSTGLVGIQPRLEKIEALLGIGEGDIRVVGVWGMGGIGKTTLARAAFDTYSSYFQGSCFLPKVREDSERLGVHQLERKLHMELDGGNSSSTAMTNQLRHKKVLIVLDDVDNYEQFEGIIGNPRLFAGGSRIIVTSRDKQVLNNVADYDRIYEVPALSYCEAQTLLNFFSLKNFNWELAVREIHDAVSYAQGHPLALKVLGLHLRAMDKEERRSALLKLKTSPDRQVHRALRISFDGLDFHDQQIFLDIACFFRRMPKAYVVRILEACGLFPIVGLRNLINRALITMNEDYYHYCHKKVQTVPSNKVNMHDLLQEMGRQIIREECINEPGSRSRLWNHREICHVLLENKGTGRLRAMSLDLSKIDQLCLSPNVFSNMKQMKFLEIYHSTGSFSRMFPSIMEHKLQFPNGLEYLPGELCYLRWDWYPLKSLPSQLVLKNLVELSLFHSNVEQLWTGVQHNLSNLKRLNLGYCECLIEVPDLSSAKQLQILNCESCKSLVELSPSIANLTSLVELNMSHSNVERLWICRQNNLSSLKRLNLSYCKQLTQMPDLSSAKQLEILNCESCESLIELSPSIANLTSLVQLKMSRSNVKRLWTGGQNNLPSLKRLNLSYCKYLTEVPDLSSAKRLEILNCDACESLVHVSRSISHLNLVEIILKRCYQIRSIPSTTSMWSLKKLDFFWCLSLNNLPNVSRNRKELDLRSSGMEELPSSTQLTTHGESNCGNSGGLAQDYPDRETIVGNGQGVFNVPGNEFPDWITDQSLGSSITIPLPPNWFNGRYLGFVLSAALDCNEDWIGGRNCSHDIFSISWIARFKSNNSDEKQIHDCIFSTHPLYRSKHVFLLYSGRSYDPALVNYNEVSFQIHPKYGKVKKCGVSLLYDVGDWRTVNKKKRKTPRGKNVEREAERNKRRRLKGIPCFPCSRRWIRCSNMVTERRKRRNIRNRKGATTDGPSRIKSNTSNE